MKKHHIIMLYCLVGFILYYGYFYHIGAYPLLDIDETRYVDMAKNMFNTKDFLTLYLNGDYFFEKPPLYFWLECLSFGFFKAVNEFSARIPMVLLSLLPLGFLIFLARKVKNDKFATVTAITLLTSLEYMFMTKIAILDSVLTSFVVSSVLSYFCTFFVEEKRKKYFWILTYLFSAFAVLAKGIPGIAIPAIVITVSTIIFKTYNETLKYSWGFLIFLLITLPWHIAMLKMYPDLFYQEYIYKHHILRFLGSDVIHRNQPWYFYFLTLFWGLFPHIFVLLSQITKIKDIKFNKQNDYSKFLLLNFITIVTILAFFSLSGAKLITYILPIYPFTAIVIGAIWYKYISSGEKNTHLSLLVFNSFLTIATICMIFLKTFLPAEIYTPFQTVQLSSLLILIPFVIINWIFILRKKKLKLFLTVSIAMALLSGFITPIAYQFNYKFGQNDLMMFSKIAKENGYTISAYLTGKKYSLLYYGNQSKINFKTDEDIDWLKEELSKKNNIVIIRNREIKSLPVKIRQKGIKYSIIERLYDDKQ